MTRDSADRPDADTPTRAELAILRVLWRRGPSTVRQVHEALAGEAKGYTTVLKLMQIMADKGLVDRDESRRSHIYHPRVAEADVQTAMTRDLMDRAFGGSASQLVMRALSAEPTSAEELDEIRAFLASMTEEGQS
jgi:predicted transcriptional regulator